jgi:hypothetical protein
VRRRSASVQAGDNRLIETDKAVRSGRTIGYTANSCTFDFAAGQAHCWVSLARPKGQLRMRVVVDAENGQSSGRIVGGTGAYLGATGTVTGQEGANPEHRADHPALDRLRSAPRVGVEPTSLVLIQSQAGPADRPTGE